MKQYVVDAFTDHVFGGNPAAVCIMEQWLDEQTMMSITKENNLSETAFAVKEGETYHLRWFTPGGEIDLCGHATLGTAFVILNFYEKNSDRVTFHTLSGELTVVRNKELFEMDFPAYDIVPTEITDDMEKAIGCRPIEAYMGRDLLCIMPDDFDMGKASVDLGIVKELDGLLLHLTSKGIDYDCVSRSFAPKLNVNEDPVCGSGHCHIVPYWTKRLHKDSLICYQASERGGVLFCQQKDNRIKMGGSVVLYSIAELNI